jgi:superfamily II DNA or RNA helicase
MQLRDYQQDIKSKVYKSWREGKRRVLIFSCTGSGKTIIAKSIIKDALSKNYKILFTCHRQILVEQTYLEFLEFNPSVIMGNDKRFNKDALLQIGSLQTLGNRDFDTPNIIICDESHYSHKAGMIPELLKRFEKSMIIGLSASPIDDSGFLLEGYDAYIDDYQICDLIEKKWLVPFQSYSPVSIDLSNISVIAGEYNQKELENVVIQEELLNTAVKNYKLYGQNRKFLVFATTQKHAKALESVFIMSGYKVGYVDANVKKPERKIILEDFKNGKLQGLVNIDVLTAGFNEKSIGCIVDCAATKRLGRYIQRVGRGTRLNGETYEESVLNGKPDIIYLDLANNISEHDMPDKRRTFRFKPMVSRVIDKKLGLTDEIERNPEKHEVISEKMVELRRIGKLLDKYEGKVYKLEKDLQVDVQNYLEKTNLFWFRQNSGCAQYSWALKKELSDFGKVFHGDTTVVNKFVEFITRGQARFVRFTSKSGLADISCFMDCLYFGIELKLRSGKLTKHQQETIPEQVSRGILIFFAESVVDVFDIIAWVEKHWNGSKLDRSIYDLYDKQIEYYRKHKLKTYSELYDKCHCNKTDK